MRQAKREATLFLDCQTGIAGDMLVAALLDMASDSAWDGLKHMLASLPVDGFEARYTHVNKSGIACADFDVVLDEAHQNHDHDMAYLHGMGDTPHEHEHEHEHGCGLHHHEHRGLVQIEQIIQAADMTPGARALAHRAFAILAQAEARAHKVDIEHVHFHEVGAVDSIVDILSAAYLIDALGITRAIVPVLVDGHGSIRCQHGVIPVPVPATLNICIAHGLPLAPGDIEGELVTPTGAALVAALDPDFELPARYTVQAVGMGAGKRAYARPSILRALLIETRSALAAPATVEPAAPAAAAASVAPGTTSAAALSSELSAPATVVKLECDIDDASPEVLAYAAEALRDAGAREVHWVPLFCKKGRPAYQLQVVCAQNDAARLTDIIFMETTTIGVRWQVMERICLDRSFERVQTEWGPVQVKCVELADGSVRKTPEYEDCARLARETGVPLQRVMAAARIAAR